MGAPIPPHYTVIHEVLVDNILGIWWGKTLQHTPIHIGIVVSERRNLESIRAEDDK